jgi:biopolymer transport protein ExbD
MSSIDTGDSGGKQKGGKVRAKKMATNIDFTPMVDLGFLLITFFMLTTTMSKPNTMEINMPVPDDENIEKTQFDDDQTMTILLGEKDKVYYYMGIKDVKLDTTDFGPNGIRKILQTKAKRLNRGLDSIPIFKNQLNVGKIDKEQYKDNLSRIKNNKKGLICVIKAVDKAKYKNVVDILDEMSINNIGIYALVDITEADEQLIAGTLPITEILAPQPN